ncbi:hypothetical protein [Bradyrhizobium macuxiense]|uniref:hypothetical protein n=1 Tax=Bradyrhizobium macuxiense TaxID=1755647 RepID=UPI0011BEAD27|nr:hypothetical protein [Bradyrhizobium macuxiense]
MANTRSRLASTRQSKAKCDRLQPITEPDQQLRFVSRGAAALWLRARSASGEAKAARDLRQCDRVLLRAVHIAPTASALRETVETGAEHRSRRMAPSDIFGKISTA